MTAIRQKIAFEYGYFDTQNTAESGTFIHWCPFVSSDASLGGPKRQRGPIQGGKRPAGSFHPAGLLSSLAGLIAKRVVSRSATLPGEEITEPNGSAEIRQ
jgi:hypothetical protein